MKIGNKRNKRDRGSKVLPEIRDYINRQAIEQREKPREDLAKEIINQLGKKYPRRVPPSIISLIKWISKARTQKNPLDNPWSLAESANPINNISPEATYDLLEVWRLCLATGYTFTIREAQWVSRIRTAIPIVSLYEITKEFLSKRTPLTNKEIEDSTDKLIMFDGKAYHSSDFGEDELTIMARANLEMKYTLDQGRLGKLYYYAHEYAIRERVSAISKKPFDTRDLDAELIMGDRERITFEALGLIPHSQYAYMEEEKSHRLLGLLSVKGNVSQLAILENMPKNARDKYFDDTKEFDDGSLEALNKRFEDALNGKLKDLKKDNHMKITQNLNSFSEGLTPSEERIFATKLVYLSKGSLWNTLSMDNYISILSCLKEGVARKVSYKDVLRVLIAADREGGLKPKYTISPDILQMVGYQVTDATKEDNT